MRPGIKHLFLFAPLIGAGCASLPERLANAERCVAALHGEGFPGDQQRTLAIAGAGPLVVYGEEIVALYVPSANLYIVPRDASGRTLANIATRALLGFVPALEEDLAQASERECGGSQ